MLAYLPSLACAFVACACIALAIAGLHAERAARLERENNPRIRVRLINLCASDIFGR